MENKLIPAVKISQSRKVRDILFFSLPAKLLREISYFNPNSFYLNLSKSKGIAKCVDSGDDVVLVDNVVVNIELDRLNLSLNDVFHNNQLDLKKIIETANSINPAHPDLKGKIAIVIDGQEKLKAFDYTDKDMPLVVTAMVNLSLAEVVEIFSKINYYRTFVNKSMAFDMLGISESVFPEYCMLYKITEKLNMEDIESPFYNKIKMLGIGKGFFSQADLITAIEKSGIIRTIEELKLSQEESMETVLYDIIWNFFKAVQEEFEDFWERDKSFARPDVIGTLCLLMKDALKEIVSKDKEFSVKEIRRYLKNNYQNALFLQQQDEFSISQFLIGNV